MADPLSVVASIAGLIEIAHSVAKHCYVYVKDVRGAKDEIEKLLAGTTELYGVLNQLYLVACRFEGEDFDSSIQTHHIYACHATLDRIRCRLEDQNPTYYSNQRKIFIKKLQWPFSKTETKDLLVDLEKEKSALSLALSAQSNSALLLLLSRQQDHSKDLVTIRKGVENLQTISISNERRKLLKSISSVDPKFKQDSNLRLRQPGSGVWFIESTNFQEWLLKDSTKLWLHGIPGAGKTILASTIIQEMQKQEHPFAYFYCDYLNSATLDSANIIASLIQQFLQQYDPHINDLEEVWTNLGIHEKSPRIRTTEELHDVLKLLLQHFDLNFIVIDGLDECTNSTTLIVSLLDSLNIPGQNNVKTLFISRYQEDLNQTLAAYNQVSISAHSSDLRLYVDSEMSTLKVRSGALRDQIRKRMIEGASGMFRWVACQLDYLRKLPHDSARRQALESLPSTLHATYERILTTVEGKENQMLVKRALIWIMYSAAPLRINTLLEAISIDEGDEDLDLDKIPDADTILLFCGSLVKRTGDGEGLELAHFTVKEFLLDPKKGSDFMQYHILSGEGEIEIAKTCLRYLCFPTFDVFDRNDPNDIIECRKTQQLYNYAATYWDIHARDHLDDTALLDCAKVLFDPKKTLQFLRWNQFISWVYDKHNPQDPAVLSMSPLHWAAYFWLNQLCEWLVNHISPNEVGGMGTPLQHALKSPHPPPKNLQAQRFLVVKTLLEAGCDVNAGTIWTYFDTPLAMAIEIHDWELISLLLQSGATVSNRHLKMMENKEPYFNGSEWKNYMKIFTLTNLGAETTSVKNRLAVLGDDVQDPGHMLDYGFALRKAAKWGQLENVVEFLSVPGLDVDTFDPLDGRTALHHASSAGHLDVVQVLITHKCDINKKDKNGWSSLQLAIVEKHMAVIQHLVESGADLDYVHDGSGASIFHLAAVSQNPEVLEFLLRYTGNDGLHLLNKDGETPLIVAAAEGGLNTLQCILKLVDSSNITARSVNGTTCLHAVAENCHREGSLEKIELLLSSGAVVNATTNDGNTPIFLSTTCLYHQLRKNKAVEIGGRWRVLDCFRRLLNTESNLILLSEDGSSLLHSLCKGKSWINFALLKSFVEALKMDETFLNLKDKNGMTALQILVSYRGGFYIDDPDPPERWWADMVELMLQQEFIEVNCRNTIFQTPLMAFANLVSNDWDNGQQTIDIMNQLLTSGSDPNLTCAKGYTALHYLVKGKDISRTSIELINLLLDYDAKTDIKDSDGRTFYGKIFNLLLISSNITDLEQLVLRIIPQISVNLLESPQSTGFTALHTAIQGCHHSITRMILGRGVDVDVYSRLSAGTPEETALEVACVVGCPKDIIQTLIASSKNLTRLNRKGHGVLHVAALCGQDLVLAELLAAGIDINMRSKDKATALHLSALSGNPKTFELLLEKGADISLRGAANWNITHFASRGGSRIICQLVLEMSQLSWNECVPSVFEGIFKPQDASPLHLAAYEENLEVVKFLIEHGLAPNLDLKCPISGLTPFLLATEANAMTMVEFLYDRSVDIHAQTALGETGLHLAVHSTRLNSSLVELLLKYGIDAEIKPDGYETAELVALRKGRPDVAEMIRRHLRVKDTDPLQETVTTSVGGASQSQTTIKPSLIREFEELVKTTGNITKCELLLSSGVDVSSLANSPASCGCSFLLLSLSENHPQIAALLLNNDDVDLGAKMCGKGKHLLGYSAVHVAAELGYYDILVKLLARSPQLSEIGIEPIHLSALNGHQECVEALIKYEKSKGDGKRTIDVLASTMSGTLSMYKNGQKLSREDTEQSALHLACASAHAHIANYLIEQGADIEVKDKSGLTPLMVAASNGHTHIVRQLHERGANIYASDEYGDTVMHLAALKSQNNVLKVLKELGADTAARNIDGALFLCDCDDLEIVDNNLNIFEENKLNDNMAIKMIRDSDKHASRLLDHLEQHSDYQNTLYGNLLNIACLWSREAGVNTILERIPSEKAAAYVNHHTKFGTPLYISSYKGNNLNIIRSLLKANAILDMIGGYHGTAFHAACAMGRVEATKLLLEHGAGITVAREDGTVISAFDLAVRHPRVLEVLEKHIEETGSAKSS